VLCLQPLLPSPELHLSYLPISVQIPLRVNRHWSRDAVRAKVLLELADRVACGSLKSRRSRWALMSKSSADYHSRAQLNRQSAAQLHYCMR